MGMAAEGVCEDGNGAMVAAFVIGWCLVVARRQTCISPDPPLLRLPSPDKSECGETAPSRRDG